jgi:hypothetical protein
MTIPLMIILLNADTLLEYLLKRGSFVNYLEDLDEIIYSSSIDLCISERGLKEVIGKLEDLHGSNFSDPLGIEIGKLFRIIPVTKFVARKARLYYNIDYNSAIEIALALENNIPALLTHKPDSFPKDRLINIITIQQMSTRLKLASNLTNTRQEQINILNSALDLPSYIGERLLAINESSHQLDIIDLPGGYIPSIARLSIQPKQAQQIIKANIPEIGCRATAHLSTQNPSRIGLVSAVAATEHASFIDETLAYAQSQSILQANIPEIGCRATAHLSTQNPSRIGLVSAVAATEHASFIDETLAYAQSQSILQANIPEIGCRAAAHLSTQNPSRIGLVSAVAATAHASFIDETLAYAQSQSILQANIPEIGCRAAAHLSTQNHSLIGLVSAVAATARASV